MPNTRIGMPIANRGILSSAVLRFCMIVEAVSWRETMIRSTQITCPAIAWTRKETVDTDVFQA